MPTVHHPSDTDPPPEPTPYFRLCAEVRKAVEREAARRGLPHGPLAA